MFAMICVSNVEIQIQYLCKSFKPVPKSADVQQWSWPGSGPDMVYLEYVNAVFIQLVQSVNVFKYYCLKCVKMCSFEIMFRVWNQIDGSVQDCSISSALAMEILQSSTKLSK